MNSAGKYQNNVLHEHFMAMNTRFDAVIYGLDSIHANDFFFELKTEVFRIENMLNRFDERSLTGIINASAFNSNIEIDEEFTKILVDCKHFFEMTRGAFDITFSPLIKIWTEALSQGKMPANSVINDTRSQLGMDKIEINTSGTIRFLSPLIQLDFGGYGKGYSLEKIRQIANRYNIKNGFFSFGDSSILALGHHPYGNCWKVGVKDYFLAQNLLVFDLIDNALSISGNTPANIIDPVLLYGKTIIPSVGNPIHGFVTSAIKSQSSICAEVYSTTLLTCNNNNYKIFSNDNILEAYLIGYTKNNSAEISKII